MMSLFDGLSASPLTPADLAGKVQGDLLATFVERLSSAGVNSIGLLGSTGGYAYLSRRQRYRAVMAAVEAVRGETPIIVGVGALRTDEAEMLAREARVAGADGLLLAPVSYLPLTDEEVFIHFTSVAGAGELPLCIYNNPGTTKFVFSDALIARLSRVANIVAVKMPLPADGDYAGELSRLRAMTPEGFAIGYSGDWGAAEALQGGCDCWYSVVAGLLPKAAMRLTVAARNGKQTEVDKLNNAFGPLWVLFKEFGSFRVMYAIAQHLGFKDLVPPRPILPITADGQRRLATALHDLAA